MNSVRRGAACILLAGLATCRAPDKAPESHEIVWAKNCMKQCGRPSVPACKKVPTANNVLIVEEFVDAELDTLWVLGRLSTRHAMMTDVWCDTGECCNYSSAEFHLASLANEKVSIQLRDADSFQSLVCLGDDSVLCCPYEPHNGIALVNGLFTPGTAKSAPPPASSEAVAHGEDEEPTTDQGQPDAQPWRAGGAVPDAGDGARLRPRQVATGFARDLPLELTPSGRVEPRSAVPALRTPKTMPSAIWSRISIWASGSPMKRAAHSRRS